MTGIGGIVLRAPFRSLKPRAFAIFGVNAFVSLGSCSKIDRCSDMAVARRVGRRQDSRVA